MATQAQIEANRRNSQLSTGPRTPEGKARSAHNALKHGLRVEAILSVQFEVLGEDPEEFSAFLESLVDALQPVGPVEEMCVESIALGLWRQRRVLRAEIGYIARHQASLRHAASSAECGQAGHLPHEQATPACGSLPAFDDLNRLMRYESHLTRQVRAAFADLAGFQSARSLDGVRESADSPPPLQSHDDIAASVRGAVQNLTSSERTRSSPGALPLATPLCPPRQASAPVLEPRDAGFPAIPIPRSPAPASGHRPPAATFHSPSLAPNSRPPSPIAAAIDSVFGNRATLEPPALSLSILRSLRRDPVISGTQKGGCHR